MIASAIAAGFVATLVMTTIMRGARRARVDARRFGAAPRHDGVRQPSHRARARLRLPFRVAHIAYGALIGLIARP
jgi:hypothetical protein